MYCIIRDEESSEEGSSWIGCDGPCGRWYNQSCVGMDKEDIGGLSEENEFVLNVLGVLLG